jgi:diguanylate cyclase (GGDEF)-like protein
MNQLIKDRSMLAMLLCALLASAAYVAFVRPTPFAQVLSDKTHDQFHAFKASFMPQPASAKDVVVVAVDNDSVDFSNKRWPWRRGFMGEILARIAEGKPKAFFFDFVISGRSEEADDLRLRQSIQSMGTAIIASYINDDGIMTLPHPYFSDAAKGVGFVNDPMDPDAVIRRSRALSLSRISLNERVGEYSAVFKVASSRSNGGLDALSYYRAGGSRAVSLKRDDGQESNISLAREHSFRIDFGFSPERLTVIPAWKVFQNRVSPDVFKDKIVLFGASADLAHDIFRTPIGFLPGIIIKAYEVITVLDDHEIADVPVWCEFVALFVLTAFIALASMRLLIANGFLVCIWAILSYYGVYALLVMQNRYADGLAPLLLGLLTYVGVNFYKQVRLRHDMNKLQLLAVTDSLTGLYIRRYFQLRLQYEWDHAQKTKVPFSLVMLDVDFFKKINDTYGHLAGDMVLTKVAATAQECCRKVDIVCRYGGEEFSVILPHTDHEGALFLAEKIRAAIEAVQFEYESKQIKVTLSCGVSTYGLKPASSPEEIIAQADHCLYRAKETGRNRVVGIASA